MRAKILQPGPKSFEILAHAIQKGEVVGMPTETVYGLAGDCFNPLALARIFETKERPTFDPLIVHVAPTQSVNPGLKAEVSLASITVEELDHQGIIDASQLKTQSRILIDRLILAFWPGPLTLILPKNRRIPDLATSGLPTVAVRMPEHPLAQALITASQRPLAAPSANRFGRISPTTAQAVAEELGERIDWILEGGTCSIGLESTILAIQGSQSGEVRILRAGGTPKERIEEVLGFSIGPEEGPPASDSFEAPGMLESHYAPRKPFILLDQPLSKLSDVALTQLLNHLRNETLFPEFSHNSPTRFTLGLLLISGNPDAATVRLSALSPLSVLTRSLSRESDLREAAHSLFSEMRALDSSPVSLILAEPCQVQEGLGYAIADRLKRASAGSAEFRRRALGQSPE